MDDAVSGSSGGAAAYYVGSRVVHYGVKTFKESFFLDGDNREGEVLRGGSGSERMRYLRTVIAPTPFDSIRRGGGRCRCTPL